MSQISTSLKFPLSNNVIVIVVFHRFLQFCKVFLNFTVWKYKLRFPCYTICIASKNLYNTIPISYSSFILFPLWYFYYNHEFCNQRLLIPVTRSRYSRIFKILISVSLKLIKATTQNLHCGFYQVHKYSLVKMITLKKEL